MSTSTFHNETIIKDISCDDVRIHSYIGEIKMWPGSSPPTNFLWCDGQSISSYTKLQDALGGATHAPDLREKFIIGSSTMNHGNNTIQKIPYHNHNASNKSISVDNVQNAVNDFYNSIFKTDISLNNQTVYALSSNNTNNSLYGIVNGIVADDSGDRAGKENRTSGTNKAKDDHTHNVSEAGQQSYGNQQTTISISEQYTISNFDFQMNANLNKTVSKPNVTDSKFSSTPSEFIPKHKTIGYIIRYQ
jgi:microcystin-dependent protein